MIRRLAALTFAVAVSALFAACGSSTGQDVCSDKCACEGCSNADANKCAQDDVKDQQNSAHAACDNLYGALVDCELNTETCFHGHFDTNCGHQSDDFHHCIDKKH